jgi:hypothetical protein
MDHHPNRPPATPTGTPTNRRATAGAGSRTWATTVAIGIALVALLVLAACSSGDGGTTSSTTDPGGAGAPGTTQAAVAAPAVLLESVGVPGPHPFTSSVAYGEPAALTEEMTTRARGLGDPATGVVLGDAPGLYGGSADVVRCDVDQLVASLDADPAKAAAFAGVLGVAPTELAAVLHDLVPVVVLADVVVTNHGFVDGQAVPQVSVLQAGTAVLVDEAGMPVVRCACGNPLVPAPDQVDLAEVGGEAWPSFDPATTFRLVPGTPGWVGFVDLTTGVFIEPTGPAAPEVTGSCGSVTTTTGETVAVVVTQGDIACNGALVLAETYYHAPPTPPEGSAAYVQIGMWSCASTSAAEAASTGALGGCESSTGRIDFVRA